MFNFFNRPLDLPPQLEWKFAHEPELLGWTIRARNYNTFVANCMFAFMTIVIMGGAYAIYSTAPPEIGYLTRIFASLGFYLLISSALISMTHQRMNFAYRLTHSGLEYCEWKELPKWLAPCLKWFSGITAIIFIFMATIDPAFLIGALIGPGGMGLMYLQIAHSKRYRELHTEYHHHFLMWSELTQLTTATNRELVELDYSVPKADSDYMALGSLYVFCKKAEKWPVSEFIKNHLTPQTPTTVGKVNVLN